jgi:hypothetical protein
MLFGVPRSLSMTYYLFKERVDNLKYLFPSMITMMVVFMMPCWLQISEGSPYQFMTFLSMAALMFVGATPAFNDSDMENHIHTVAAYVCAIFASLWIILVTPYWYIIPIVFAIIAAIAILTKTVKRSYIYWLENVAFISTFIAMLTYFERVIKITL